MLKYESISNHYIGLIKNRFTWLIQIALHFCVVQIAMQIYCILKHRPCVIKCDTGSFAKQGNYGSGLLCYHNSVYRNICLYDWIAELIFLELDSFVYSKVALPFVLLWCYLSTLWSHFHWWRACMKTRQHRRTRLLLLPTWDQQNLFLKIWSLVCGRSPTAIDAHCFFFFFFPDLSSTRTVRGVIPWPFLEFPQAAVLLLESLCVFSVQVVLTAS